MTIQEEITETRTLIAELTGRPGYGSQVDAARGYIAGLQGRGELLGRIWGLTANATVRSSSFNQGVLEAQRWLKCHAGGIHQTILARACPTCS